MTRLPIFKAREVIRALEKLGFSAMRQKGSHRGEDISRGLLHQILGEIGISPEEFLDVL